MDTDIIQATADAILQNPVKVTVGERTYSIAPPTIATLIEASKYIAHIPDINIDESNDESIIAGVLSEAKNCAYIGDITAILMLGKKNLVSEKKYLFGLITRKVDNVSKLSKVLLENLSVIELHGLVFKSLKMHQPDFFFGLLIFLKSINQIKPAKTPTTASGQLSQA
jgi:hypothetical protein